jgi:hypothetical protein
LGTSSDPNWGEKRRIGGEFLAYLEARVWEERRRNGCFK